MATVAVAHADLMAKGGGESVGVNTLEALQDDHDVVLLTLTRPDWEELEAYYDVDVHDVAVRSAPTLSRLLDRVDAPLYNLRLALLNRHVRRHEADVDIVVGTDNELSVGRPSIQYIHTPRFGRLVTAKRVGEDRFVDHLYDRLSYRIGGYDVGRIRAGCLLSNSRFMANIVQDVYGVRPRVVRPPVDTRGFEAVPWDEREAGFLAIGRLAPYKDVETTIRIVDGVRERGHDVHLHVVGPTYDEAYRAELQSMAETRPHVELEGELSRSDLVAMICSHRYGLHGKRNEHFGMAVAELAGGGAIPFVPDSGGQREIVRGADQQFATPGDAIEKIDAVLSDPALEERLRPDTREIRRRFGRDRFRDAMRDLVDAVLERTAERPPGEPGQRPSA